MKLELTFLLNNSTATRGPLFLYRDTVKTASYIAKREKIANSVKSLLSLGCRKTVWLSRDSNPGPPSRRARALPLDHGDPSDV